MEKLTAEEVQILVDQTGAQTVSDFTTERAQQRAMFARSVVGSPLFKQGELARIMAEGAGDETFIQSIIVPDGDTSEQAAEQNKQTLENAALALGMQPPILPKDNDWVHMQTLKGPLTQQLQNPNAQTQMIQGALQHYAGHYSQGVAKKGLPEPAINDEKSFIAGAEKVLNQLMVRDQIKQHAQQLEQLRQQDMQTRMGGGIPQEGGAPPPQAGAAPPGPPTQ
jgi:hypothetical protein